MALASCSWIPSVQPRHTADLGRILGTGVQCLLTPSSEYKPGTVFRIDDKNVSYFANRTLRDRLPLHPPADAAVGILRGKQDINIGLLASLLTLSQPGTDLASIHASFNQTRTIDAELEGVKYETTDDTDIDQVMNWFDAYNYKRPGSKYYVVREAWLANAMGLKITKNLKIDFGGEATFDKIIKVNPTIKYDPEAEYDLTKPFSTPLRVCIKPEELVYDAPGATGPTYKRVEVRERLNIVKQGVDDE